MSQHVVNKTIPVLGNNLTSSVTVTSDGRTLKDPTVAAAKAGSLTTRTDTDTGVATMVAGHGFATSDKLDVYWSGGSRRGMTATVAVNAVTIDGGTGDSLPVLSTALKVMKPQSETCVVDKDDIVAVVVNSPKIGTITFRQADGTLIKEYPLTAANAVEWNNTSGETSPFTADVGKIDFSHGEADAVAMLALLYVN